MPTLSRPNAIDLAAWEHLPARMIVRQQHYQPGERLAEHTHLRDQLLFAATGMMSVSTSSGWWIVPSHQAVWIPAGMPHSVEMLQAVTTCSLYWQTEQAFAPLLNCEVKSIRPLIRELLIEASQFDFAVPLSQHQQALLNLLQLEIPQLPAATLGLPLPVSHPLLRQLCETFARRPNIHQPMEEWIERLHVSRRTFSRHFQKHTGKTYSEWIQLACLIHALPRIAKGEAINAVALDIGFEHPSAFSLMCKRLTGVNPSYYLSHPLST